MKKIISKYVVGVDVSKEWLDAYIYPADKHLRIDNSLSGIKILLTTLSRFTIEQAVCESSGGYECLLVGQLGKNGYKTWRVDPKRIKAFRESEGIRVKTDKLDAKIIAMFAASKRQAYVPYSPTENDLQLQSVVRRRDDLRHMCTMEKLRLENPQQHCKSSIKTHIKHLEQQILELDNAIEHEIDSNEEWKKKRDILQSAPGIGKKVVASIIADMPELGKIENKAAAALLGVAPFNQESGKRQGKSYLAGGRGGPRNILYMAILSACRCNPVIKEFYQRLIAAGKKPKVALIACMNKMIRILNSMLKKQELWKCEKA